MISQLDMTEFTIYQAENGNVEVRLDKDTVWLSQEQMASLFDVQKAAGACLHGVRGRARKHGDAEEVHEEPEEYSPRPRSTRYIESSLGIKSYAELAPFLAKEVERVMASLLEKSPDELKITPEYI